MDRDDSQDSMQGTGLEIAVVGVAGRFPGAPNVETFWQNLVDGRESIRFFSDQELLNAGVDRATLEKPNYVRASGYLEDADLFDAEYFRLNPREAELMDPQHRIFLELVVEALEGAGYAGDGEQVVGVYAGASENSYFISNLLRNPAVLGSVGLTQAMIGIQKDFLATRVSYKLDLRGPSLTVQTACSTSLVATHLACQGLVSGECDVAVAGGVSVRVPAVRGYHFEDDGISSPDGHCRAFDAMARGTVAGSGAGVVVLRRLADALADGDPILAVIKGSVINNDGALKAGFTAPSVDGQAMVVRTAHLVAEVEPESITCVEAHGTATPLGDPIEFTALSQAFDADPEDEPFCALGSVKSNIGHLDAASGVASLIKTVLALNHRLLPPSLHFENPNPQIDFASSPFYVNTEARPWPEGPTPRRAGVSSFGIGGTNAHLILEEAPEPEPRAEDSSPREQELLILSAHTESALETLTERVEEHLRLHPELDPADVAYTLQLGRWPQRHRRVLVSRGLEDARQGLRDPSRLLGGRVDDDGCEVFFLYSGLGEQSVGMGREFYEGEPTFREAVDHCCELLLPRLGVDLREVLYPSLAAKETPAKKGSEALDLRALRRRAREGAEEVRQGDLSRTDLAHPAVFVVGYALTELWREWGIHPQGAIGYSLGEYLAAWQAGVFSLEDALTLVSERARLIQQLPSGRMLAVPLGAAELQPLLGKELSLAAVNAPSLSVAAGPAEAVATLQETLNAQGVSSRLLNTEHAFHSQMMQPIADQFRDIVAQVPLERPSIPFVSNVTGTWIRPEDAVDPAYWVRHLCDTVRFSEGAETLLQKPGVALLEIGPGRSLASFVRQHADGPGERMVTSSLPPAEEGGGQLHHVLRSLGLLWLSGAPVDWSGFQQNQGRRIPLPTYPFERRRYWIEPAIPGDWTTLATTTFPTAEQEPQAIPERDAEAVSTSHGRPQLATPFVPPSGHLEAAVAGIWQEVLGLTQVGVHDDFFELGGHSLLATRVLSSLQELFHIELSLGRFFTARTVAELARVVEELRPSAELATPSEGTSSASRAIPIPRAVGRGLPGGQRVFLVSFAQQRLWFLDQLVPGNAFYNLCSVLRLRGSLRWPALAGALREIVHRHESQRTTFSTEEGQPVQIVHPTMEPPESILPTVDLTTLGETKGRTEARRLALAEGARPFDLSHGPLLRTTLLRLREQEHILLLNQHHIISDAWSGNVFSQELEALYGALHGAPAGSRVRSPLPDLGIQYADFAVWQREQLAGQRLEELLDYWKRQLGVGPTHSEPPTLDLPTDRPRPKVQSFQGAGLHFELSSEVTEALRAVGHQQGATLAMVLLAAFDVLLFRMSGQERIIVGSPIAGRNRAQLEGLLGFFVNTLAMVGDLRGDPSFEEFLGRVRDASLEAHTHQDLPFEKLVEDLGLDRDLSRNALFQVVLALQNTAANEVELPDLELEPILFEFTAARFDLELHLLESAGGLIGVGLYDTALFDKTTIARMMRHFRQLLEDLVANPAQRLRDLKWITPAEEQQLLVEWNEPILGPGSPTESSVMALVGRQSEAAPDSVAFAGTRGRRDWNLSYGELRHRAHGLATELRHLGVAPEVPVAVLTGRSPAMIVSYLAVLEAGGCYLPLDPEIPPSRLRWMLKDSGAGLLLTTSELAERIEEPGDSQDEEALTVARMVVGKWSGLPEGPREGKGERRRRPTHGENAAYLIYTSGSTGRPKGVAVSHRSLLRLVQWHRQTYDLTAGERTSQVAAVGFDASVWEIWPTLAAGATLQLPSSEVVLEPAKLLNYFASHRIQVAFLPTPLAQMAVEEVGAGDGGTPGRVPGWALRVLLTGGDALRPVRGALPFRLVNHYGPTENTVVATAAAVPLASSAADVVVPPPIGRPLPYVKAYVGNAESTPLPAGVAGELLLGGDGLARGYHGRPALSADRFVPDPFRAQAGGRMYRTGDLVRSLPDGTLDFLGRLDHQVKVRGFRIELGEIETVLNEVATVRQAVVVAREEGAAARRLVAYVVTEEGEEEEQVRQELRTLLRHRLPEYMVPSTFVVLPELPLRPSGKVDRRALPVPEVQGEGSGLEVAPRTAEEEKLAVMWQGLLHSGEGAALQVGVHDDFFALGGHSLLAVRLLSQIRDFWGVELSVRTIFENPTLEELARYLESTLGGGKRELEPIPRQRRDIPRQRRDGAPFPLSFAQQRLWFLDVLEPGSAFYNIPGALMLVGELQVEALRRSFEEVVRRHEALRTSFPLQEEKPVQEIDATTAPWKLPVVDLGHLEDASGPLHHLLRQEAERPFVLQQAPLLRTVLFRLQDQRHILFLAMHHIISDGWSVGILVQELGALYAAFCRGEVPQGLPELKIQYADFALWQRQWLAGEVLEEQLAYWKQRLSGVQPLDLASDRPRPPVQNFHGATHSFELSKELSAGLGMLSREQGASLFMTLLAAFKVLLSRYSGQRDIAVGTPIANRHHSEIENLVGFFANSLVLRSDLGGRGPGGGDLSYLDLLTGLRAEALTAYAHQDLPFEQLVNELGVERDLSRAPLFQVMFAWQDAAEEELRLPGLSIAPLAVETGTSKFDLTLQMSAGDEHFSGTLEYSTELFDATTISRMVRHLTALLQKILHNPGEGLAELSQVTDSERHQILREWNDTAYPQGPSCPQGPAAPREPEPTIPEVFAEQVMRTSEAVALAACGTDEQVSYGELDRRAHRLARFLRRQVPNAAGEMAVGICLQRSVDLLVALLGTLKAGGFYVPLDPEYPQERVRWMLRDAGVSILLTRREIAAVEETAEVRRIDFDALDEVFAGAGEEDHGEDDQVSDEVQVTASNLAYVMYTSGSTGRPKGVAVPHRGVVRLVRKSRFMDFHPREVFLQLAPISFDAATLEIWGPLLNGGRLAIFAPGVPTLPEVGAVLGRQRVSALWLTAGLFHLMVDEEFSALAGVRQLLAGGDVLSTTHVRRLLQELPATHRLINGYGPTENTTFTTCFPMSSGAGVEDSVPIGRPIHRTHVAVVDGHGQAVPGGVRGELVIGGEGLARGYYRQPALSAERFVPDPLSPQPGGRVYRTGDLARFRADGNLEFFGRSDHQIKIRGFRIELGEIEAVLNEHAAVSSAVVVAPQDASGGRRLLAYLKLGEPESSNGLETEVSQPTPEQASRQDVLAALRATLGRQLPQYMMPSAFVVLPEFPLDPNGKVDRRALPNVMEPAPGEGNGEPSAATGDDNGTVPFQGEEFQVPASEHERLIASTWTEVLGIEEVRTHENFFDLGGHSLALIQIHSKLRRLLGRDLQMVKLFEYPTVASLADYLEHAETAQPQLSEGYERATARKRARLRRRRARGKK